MKLPGGENSAGFGGAKEPSQPSQASVFQPWLLAGAAEITRGHEIRGRRAKDTADTRIRPVWTPREEALLIALGEGVPFSELCTGWSDLVDCMSAVAVLAFRGLIEPGPDGAEPVLTRLGLLTASRLQDDRAFTEAGQ